MSHVDDRSDINQPLLNEYNNDNGEELQNHAGASSHAHDASGAPRFIDQAEPLGGSPVSAFQPTVPPVPTLPSTFGKTLAKHASFVKRPAAGVARARKLPWICIDEQGHRSYIHADKRTLISRAGLYIPPRDTRLLDFSLVQSEATILVRDNAIIAALEHVRLIITADKVIIPREGAEHYPLAARFVDVLEDAIADWIRQKSEFARAAEEEASKALLGQSESKSLTSVVDGITERGTDISNRGKATLHTADVVSDVDDASSFSGGGQMGELEPLPFELIVLEVALKEVVATIASQTKELEAVAVPALDQLTRSVSSSNLERVRRVKTRHQRLTIRCEALRDELQRFLRDDEDCARMALTRRKEEMARLSMLPAGQGSDDGKAAEGGGGGGGGGFVRANSPRPLLATMAPSLARRSFFSRQFSSSSPPRQTSGQLAGKSESNASASASAPQGGVAAQLAAATAAEMEAEADAEAQLEVENLLESYYMQVDSLYDKLVSLGEYAKDTEEYINIELDSSRNRLIRIEVVLTVATFAIMPFNLLAGILGENLVIPEQITGSVSRFYGVNAVAAFICLSLFYSLMLYMRYTKLL